MLRRRSDPEPGGKPGHPGLTRRQALAAGTALGLFAWASLPLSASAAAAENPETLKLLSGAVTIDMHSHAGSVIGLRRIETHAPFSAVAEPMREGGMAVICLAIVADSPATRATKDRRIRPFRQPAPGELHDYAQRAFARAHAMIGAEGLTLIADAAGLRNARSARPGALIASEGGDFLEGRLERLDEAYDRWRLRHLQLTHYRVNELGDIQTEPAVHGGLTAFGAEVIRRCNGRGIVVDIAHGTFDLVKRAADVTTKPLVLSHTSLNHAPGPRSRTVSPEHAKLVAQTGGVIGIWPPSTIFPNMDALATGMARMADVVGVDHVGLGSDMMGLLSRSALPNYRHLPALAAALLARGFTPADMLKILGGNYLRVALATMV
ncbi:MAG TPA: membrane dipeptidase [Ferrovibrio sp.]|uniref:dipeptidase n=1 Tax=Ferrovibrio sp. TaxID=1917215 RepID=UPI002ED04C67